MRKQLTREDILNALDLPTELVEVPRWGGDVLVKAMPMASRRYLDFVYGSPDHRRKGADIPEETQIRRFVGAVVLAALDPDTEEPMFRWSDADDLREKHWNSVLLVATKAFELAGDDEEEEAEEPEPEPGGDETPAEEDEAGPLED